MNRTVSLFATLLLLSTHVAAKPPEWIGAWKLNLEESEKVSKTYEEGSGTGRAKIFNNMNISIGGLPLPSMGKIPPMSGMAPKNPDVLISNTMLIRESERGIELLYDQAKQETLRKGSYRGRDSTWSRKKIQQKYKTPERRVTKTWTLRSDGRLRVDVKLNPKRERSKTFSRVFDRVDPSEIEAAEEPG